LSLTSLARIETGHQEAHFGTILRLASALGLKGQDLVAHAEDTIRRAPISRGETCGNWHRTAISLWGLPTRALAQEMVAGGLHAYIVCVDPKQAPREWAGLRVNAYQMDRLTKKKRSWLMSRIRSVDTGPERIIRTLVTRMRFTFRSYAVDLPGRPDLVFRRQKKLIYVHGCFWHGHVNCSKGRLPKTNRRFWQDKLIKNSLRDRRVSRQVTRMGWKSLTIWTCQLTDIARVERRIKRFLS